MPKTARDLITAAAKTAGVIDSIESLESGEVSHALDELNNIVEQWNIDEYFPYVNNEYTWNPPYTVNGKILIGPATEGTVDIDAPRPNRIKGVAVLTDNRYVPLEYISPNTLADSNIRNANSFGGTFPAYYTYHTTFPIGEIEIFPAIDSNPFFITVQNVLENYTLNDTIDLPNGYYPALQYELASVLAAIYGNMEMVPQLEKMAKERIARVKRLNNRPRLLSHDGTPLGNQGWDIRSRGYH